MRISREDNILPYGIAVNKQKNGAFAPLKRNCSYVVIKITYT